MSECMGLIVLITYELLIVICGIFLFSAKESVRNIEQDISEIKDNVDNTESYLFKIYMAERIKLNKEYGIDLDAFCKKYVDRLGEEYQNK